ncbi:hypothetical protein CU254_12700 [Amycolatopsis sp. AA4]|nr:hypothetical protein CU254_12700 [Amycolatopsis sp. AA4]
MRRVRSASGIANPADSAIGMAAPFAGSDVDADFAHNVANQARATGGSQVDPAQVAANDTAERARIAAEVAPACQAAADAADSASAAARSAAGPGLLRSQRGGGAWPAENSLRKADSRTSRTSSSCGRRPVPT